MWHKHCFTGFNSLSKKYDVRFAHLKCEHQSTGFFSSLAGFRSDDPCFKTKLAMHFGTTDSFRSTLSNSCAASPRCRWERSARGCAARDQWKWALQSYVARVSVRWGHSHGTRVLNNCSCNLGAIQKHMALTLGAQWLERGGSFSLQRHRRRELGACTSWRHGDMKQAPQ